MSLETIRLIRCDGMSQKHPEKRCGNRAEVEPNQGAANARWVLRKSGWKRVRRGQSMIDLCNWCSKPKKKGPQ